jgi:hypothetical protein
VDPTGTPPTQPDHLPAAAALEAAAALSDQLRQQMYGFIRQAHRPVSREEATQMAGISRKLAAFHLARQVGQVGRGRVTAGSLRAGRRNPQGGPHPKVYEPTDAEVHISIPAREHGLLADILIDALLTKTRTRTAAQPVSRPRVTAAPSSAPPNASGPGPGA